MKYRDFGDLDWKVSALGFGAMRLPHEKGDPSAIIEDQARDMVIRAIQSGVNYIDTAYPYHGGKSEPFLGEVLKGEYRDKVRIATKLPCWQVKSGDDFDRFFHQQLERLQTDRIDFYLLHGIQRDWWDRMKDLGYLDWAEKKLADGSIKHLGFSFHDQLPLFKRIVDEYDNWAMTLLMYNYMDIDYQAGTEGVKYAADNGLGVVVMEPLRGGLLAKEPPESVKKIFDSSGYDRSYADWSLQWLWDQSEVSCVISGMSSMQQVEENLASADVSGIGSMTETEKDVLRRVREAYMSRKSIPCTDCRYCMPCPQGVAIPWIMSYYNLSMMYDDRRTAIAHYNFLDESNRADRCTECGKCMEHCPQHIQIIETLKMVHRHLTQE